MIISGADPGRKGAIVALDTESTYCNHYKLSFDKAGELDIDALGWWLACTRPDMVLLEKVGGRKGWGAVQTFNFGSAYGQLLAALKSFRIPRRMVPPQTWQRVAHEGVSGGLTPKERTMAAISQSFPGCPKIRHDGVADAFLLAWFGVHKYGKSPRLIWDFKNLL